MEASGILIEGDIPQLEKPVIVAGFEGWGNALDIANSMLEYLIKSFDPHPFARLEPDIFYRYDEIRPVVLVENGVLKEIKSPEGLFYAVQSPKNRTDLVFFKAHEPQLNWFYFVDELIALCEQLDVEWIVTIGSMYDNVLHSDRLISAMSSDTPFPAKLEALDIIPISYQGPSAIHSLIHAKAMEKGFKSVSLWCHCPYYLEGTPHYGILSALGKVLMELIGFDMDISELDRKWNELHAKIRSLIDNNPKLQDMIKEIRKTKITPKPELKKNTKDEKVIDIKDFLDP